MAGVALFPFLWICRYAYIIMYFFPLYMYCKTVNLYVINFIEDAKNNVSMKFIRTWRNGDGCSLSRSEAALPNRTRPSQQKPCGEGLRGLRLLRCGCLPLRLHLQGNLYVYVLH